VAAAEKILALGFFYPEDGDDSSETSAHTRSTRRHIPEDGILHSHRREDLKSYITTVFLYKPERRTVRCLQMVVHYPRVPKQCPLGREFVACFAPEPTRMRIPESGEVSRSWRKRVKRTYQLTSSMHPSPFHETAGRS
jgi:hypothetical protein